MVESIQNIGGSGTSELDAHPAGDFDTMFEEAVSAGMQKVLGNGGTQAILFHLDLPSLDNPKKFHEKLDAIFGMGTPSLERVIIQQLHQSMGFQPASTKSGGFVDQVELARRSFLTARRDRRR
jgi:hypothetical protein